MGTTTAGLAKRQEKVGRKGSDLEDMMKGKPKSQELQVHRFHSTDKNIHAAITQRARICKTEVLSNAMTGKT